MANYIEPYAKENNILQLSLFYFGKGSPEQTHVEWSDEVGSYSLACIGKYGVPGSFDQDCYTATMRIWVKRGMPKGGIKLNYSDIARELGLDPPRAWVNRIKKSLKKLSMARYEFVECFIFAKDDQPQKITTSFSLFDSTSLFEYREGKSKRNSESQLIFPEKIRENLEAKYYQLLDMAWYKALPPGLSRRLYEYLAKRKYHSINNNFTIFEEAICRWLPITDKHSTKRRQRLQNIAQALVDAGYLSSYEFDKKRKLCIFSYQNSKGDIAKVVENEPCKFKRNSKKKNCNVGKLEDLISLLKTKPTKRLKEVIAVCLKEKGYEHVRWNILYANKKAKKSYSAYLQKTLKENWALEWSEEEKERIEEKERLKFMEQQRKEKEKRELEEQAKLKEKKRKFIIAASNLGEEMKQKKLKEAEKHFSRNHPGRSLNVKIKFVKLLCEFLGYSEKLAEDGMVLDTILGEI